MSAGCERDLAGRFKVVAKAVSTSFGGTIAYLAQMMFQV